jgi:glycosyltransferase involved in cell wall biosynthesis
MSEKIKVLQCIRQGQIGGGESHLLSLVEHLDKDRFEPVVLSFTDGPMINRLKEMDIPVHIIPTTKPFDFTKWKEVKRLLQKEKVQLVHAHGTRANSNVLWAARSLGIPVIYTVHGWSFHPDQGKIVRTIRVMGERYLTSKSDVNISVSASNQKTGKIHMGTFESIVINNGIDLEKFDPARPKKNIRGELGIPTDAVLILFIARFTSHKQPLTLIRAFAEALTQNARLHLLMVGDGDQKEEALALVHELKIEKNISLEKFRQDVPDVLAAADIFVLPSLWEGLPIGLLEAMAMGKAIIASEVDGTSEIVRHNENGWLISTDNLQANLTRALVALSMDTEKRKYFERNAVITVNEKFNAVNMTKQIEEVYARVMKEKITTRARQPVR